MGPPEENTESGGEPGGSASDQEAGSAEPTFSEESGGSEGLPDLTDEPSLEDSPSGTGAMPGAAGQSSARGSAGAGQMEGQAGSQSGGQSTGQAGGQTGGQPGSQSVGSGYGRYGTPTGMPTGSGGPLTPAEQVAILDARLEKGAGEFDALIMKAEAEQREASRAAAKAAGGAGSTGRGGMSGGMSGGISASSADAEEGNSPYDEGGMADAGGYSTGGGLGGAGGGQPPQDTTKYPAPAGIPSGSDDDVVARQLREAAEREADPAVRAKLWDEYRKYKGIN